MSKVKTIKMVKFFLFFLLSNLFFVQRSFAFLNIEALRSENKPGFLGSFGVRVDGNKGNTDTHKSKFVTQNMFKGQESEFLFVLSQVYGEASNVKNANNGSAHLRYARNISAASMYETFLQAEYSEFKNLELRQVYGFGLRFKVIDTKSSSINLGSGSFYEIETIQEDQDQENFRGNVYTSAESKLKEDLEAVFVLYYQPSFKSVKDYRIQVDSGLEFELYKNLKVSLELKYAYDSRPPRSVKREDISYMTGLNYRY